MIDFYYWPTPNARKISILFEELNLKYNLIKIDINKGEQFGKKFLEISPNNKIPAIQIKKSNETINLFESGAILLYFSEQYKKFLPHDLNIKCKVIQWLFWQMGGFGPMLGQAHHFNFYAKESIEYAKDRYSKEAYRLYNVLNNQLKENEWVVGEYSIADMAIFPWTRTPERQGIDSNEFSEVLRWRKLMNNRPAVIKGMNIGNELRKDPDQKLTDEEYENLFGDKQYKRR
tara:strand:- start:133 stop:825 length:693 start_codon:yes stop_codon:yes gene_type:complete